MANIAQLTKLFEAISERDWQQARAIGREIARAEDEIGHHSAAQRLRGALNARDVDVEHPSRSNGNSGQLQEEFGGFLHSALLRAIGAQDLDAIRLKPSTRTAIDEVITEWLYRDELARRHLERRSKLLFHGPPGCGKSATARAIGRALGLPVYIVRFDAVVGAYLGQTALHLRQLFRFAETTPCLMLVDEIDALGKRRGNPLDIGELDRVVIALLQELEHSKPSGLFIATSNLAAQLDDALWRRFDLVLDFPKPSQKSLHEFAANQAKARSISLTKEMESAIAKAKSYADAERVIDAAERRLVLRGR